MRKRIREIFHCSILTLHSSPPQNTESLTLTSVRPHVHILLYCGLEGQRGNCLQISVKNKHHPYFTSRWHHHQHQYYSLISIIISDQWCVRRRFISGPDDTTKTSHHDIPVHNLYDDIQVSCISKINVKSAFLNNKP